MKCSKCKKTIKERPIPRWHTKAVCGRCWTGLNYKRKLLTYSHSKKNGEKQIYIVQ